MKPLNDQIGASTLIMIIAGVIIILIAGSFATVLMSRIAQDVLGQSVMCDTFCEMQSTVKEVTTLDMIPSPGLTGTLGYIAIGAVIGSVVPGIGTAVGAAVGAIVGVAIAAVQHFASWLGRDDEDVARDLAIDYLVRPEGMGCYCGVSDARGKYIHFLTPGPSSTRPHVAEFHLTDQTPEKHLQEEIIDTDGNTIFKHGGYGQKSNCEDELSKIDELDNGEYLVELDIYPGCIILSTTDDNCAIWAFNETFAITNEEGKSIREQAEEQDKIIFASTIRSDDPVNSLGIAEEIEASGRHESQRMLLEHYEEGIHPFQVHVPVVCKSEERTERRVQDPLDRACREQCHDGNALLWASRCFEEPEDAGETYYSLEEDFLPEEYDDTRDLCPMEDEDNGDEDGGEDENNNEDRGYPFCLCNTPRSYSWELDEEYAEI